MEPDLESPLIDLSGVPFTSLRDLDGDLLRQSLRHVVERAGHVSARYRSSNPSGGERID
ncbi:hypothetical protein [Lentzea xinjiangensis]|uniref:hypothetical protein n=1 Tax=Lentzea xinjiangensis TaxID=402600 RepID=UPI001FE45EC0|nr:hypothetical protein [Lentzea xinjiangensis]